MKDNSVSSLQKEIERLEKLLEEDALIMENDQARIKELEKQLGVSSQEHFDKQLLKELAWKLDREIWAHVPNPEPSEPWTQSKAREETRKLIAEYIGDYDALKDLNDEFKEMGIKRPIDPVGEIIFSSLDKKVDETIKSFIEPSSEGEWMISENNIPAFVNNLDKILGLKPKTESEIQEIIKVIKQLSSPKETETVLEQEETQLELFDELISDCYGCTKIDLNAMMSKFLITRNPNSTKKVDASQIDNCPDDTCDCEKFSDCKHLEKSDKVDALTLQDSEEFLLHLIDVTACFTAEQNQYYATDVRKKLIAEAKATFKPGLNGSSRD